MTINYKGLWKMLIDKEMSKAELRKLTGIAPSTFSKMSNNEYVSMDVLVRMCKILKCQISDIVQVDGLQEVPSKNE
jgi:putative transcriptional regulator